MEKGISIHSRPRSLGDVVSCPGGVRAEPRPKTNLVTLLLYYTVAIIVLNNTRLASSAVITVRVVYSECE